MVLKAENLRTLKIPFRIKIRHNVHKGNAEQIPVLRAFIEKLAEESGNQLKYYSSPVSYNYVSSENKSEKESENGAYLSLLGGDDEDNIEIGMINDIDSFRIRTHFCGANVLSSVAIDEKGRLYKCLEDIGNQEYSFGSAAEWDIKNPIFTAEIPGNLISYLNASFFSEGEECMKCIFLPVCAGGCPLRKIRYGHRMCVAYKNTPEKYALAFYENAKKKKGG